MIHTLSLGGISKVLARNHEVIHYLIQCGVDVRSVDSDGLTALHYAAIYGHAQVAAVLLEVGVDIDARHPHDWTALNMAADCGNIEIIIMLVKEGADLDVVVCERGVAGNG